MIGRYYVTLIQMMSECRARSGDVVPYAVDGAVDETSTVVLASPGSNGGDALAAARRLCVWGTPVTVLLAIPEPRLSEAAIHQLPALRAVGSRVVDSADCTEDGAVVDGRLSYNSEEEPRGCLRQAHRIGKPTESGAGGARLAGTPERRYRVGGGYRSCRYPDPAPAEVGAYERVLTSAGCISPI